MVIDGGRTNFINPSVQDYLSRETADTTVLSTLARCVPSIASALSLWKKMTATASRKMRAKVADALLETLVSGDVEGRLPLHELADLVGDLVLAKGDTEICEALRKRGIAKLFWTNEGKLPILIDELAGGRYSHLPHARAYARYLRLQIFRYVSPEREYAMELATLASNLASSKVGMSDQFYSNFDQATEEAADVLDLNSIGRNEDPEQLVGEWLEHIEKIEGLTSTMAFYWKKSDFEERIAATQQARESRQQRGICKLRHRARNLRANDVRPSADHFRTRTFSRCPRRLENLKT
ncbi:hypothetical protein JOH52_006756 [Sinorhizobium meliloti]|uniref:hypothetical protein n=1 Tax=Rhizobium meliloti TaxID=382 RepID=UPI0011690BFE|nr:hypothetical protein [Sinorhizobium meliloti]MBP2470664.1 hypothetical protein [Sinorhizobium meliloti]MDE4550502.1 hypothetical protein [Sinorhizobium meliloti]MDE4598079.1 hypothetical protein [Sinorhizobium meliloti]GEC41717.1 hypothetical protein EME01_57890 [Sinorhizobium meliloti]